MFSLFSGEVYGHQLEGVLYDTCVPSNIVRPEYLTEQQLEDCTVNQCKLVNGLVNNMEQTNVSVR